MKPLPALLLGLILLLSCRSNKTSLPEFGEDIYEAIKTHDYERFAQHTIPRNKGVMFKFDTLFGKIFRKLSDEEMDRALRENFNEIQEELFDRNIIWKRAVFLGFNYFEQSSSNDWKKYYGKLNFEVNGKQHVIHVGDIVLLEDGRYYLQGLKPLAM
jgi:hypothetical protein